VGEYKKGGTGVAKIPPPYPFRHMLLKEKKVMSGNARYLNDAG